MTRLLLIDDEPLSQSLILGLRSEGFEVTSAVGGGEGERLAMADDVRLVILNLPLSSCEGRDVLGVLHRRKPAVPVIVLSVREQLADRIAALDAGAVDFLVKPCSSRELAARIRAHLRRANWE